MGLIKAAVQSVSSVLADQWEDYFNCNSLSNEVLMTKGIKQAGKNKGTNVISNGSVIVVNEGQCALLVDQGKVTEVVAESGAFTYDSSSQPSIFFGDLGENIKDTFNEIGKRFAFGGETPVDQRVYYINTKDIIGNKYGTANPIPFRVVDRNINLDVDIEIRCHGEYAFKIVDPVLFYTNICANVADEFTVDRIASQMKSDLLTALQPAFAKISEMGIRYSALPGHTTEIADALNEILSSKWGKQYGIKITSFGVSSVDASEEDEKMIRDMQKTGALQNQNMAAATLVQAQADAMKAAASNTSTGPMMAFAGMNMAQQAGGANPAQFYQAAAMQQQAQAPAPTPAPAAPAGDAWTCSCGAVNTGNFCTNCGSKRPAPATWTCSCGAVNTGNFCTNCGTKRP